MGLLRTKAWPAGLADEAKLMAKMRRYLLAGGCAVLLVAGMAYFALLLEGGEWGKGAEAYSQGAALPFALQAVVGLALLVALVRMVAEVAICRTPFTRAQSFRLLAIGALLVASALLEGAHIDVLLIAAAFVSFYLSYVFKYGSFLQWAYDETI